MVALSPLSCKNMFVSTLSDANAKHPLPTLVPNYFSAYSRTTLYSDALSLCSINQMQHFLYIQYIPWRLYNNADKFARVGQVLEISDSLASTSSRSAFQAL